MRAAMPLPVWRPGAGTSVPTPMEGFMALRISGLMSRLNGRVLATLGLVLTMGLIVWWLETHPLMLPMLSLKLLLLAVVSFVIDRIWPGAILAGTFTLRHLTGALVFAAIVLALAADPEDVLPAMDGAAPPK